MNVRRMNVQQLSAPDGPVRTVSRPVKRESQRGGFMAVLGKHAINMGEVMLQAENGKTGVQRVCGGQIIRVPVADHSLPGTLQASRRDARPFLRRRQTFQDS